MAKAPFFMFHATLDESNYILMQNIRYHSNSDTKHFLQQFFASVFPFECDYLLWTGRLCGTSIFVPFSNLNSNSSVTELKLRVAETLKNVSLCRTSHIIYTLLRLLFGWDIWAAYKLSLFYEFWSIHNYIYKAMFVIFTLWFHYYDSLKYKSEDVLKLLNVTFNDLKHYRWKWVHF